MTDKNKYNILTFLISIVWLINGLLCKVLNLVPRHELIVAEILKVSYSKHLTIIIGIFEIFLAIYIITKYKSKLTAIFQITLVITMNLIEFIVVPELLLWGRFNLIFALLFVFIIYYNEFILKRKINLEGMK